MASAGEQGGGHSPVTPFLQLYQEKPPTSCLAARPVRGAVLNIRVHSAQRLSKDLGVEELIPALHGVLVITTEPLHNQLRVGYSAGYECGGGVDFRSSHRLVIVH